MRIPGRHRTGPPSIHHYIRDQPPLSVHPLIAIIITYYHRTLKTMTTILVVPGAWITKAFYEPFLHALTVAGYDVHYAGYPSLDPKDPTRSDCQADTEAITAVLRPLVENEGKDVLLFLHSYAGMPGAAAATGLAKSQRTQSGQAGGVIGLLFLGAFVVPEGLSCADLQGGHLPPWIVQDQVKKGRKLPSSCRYHAIIIIYDDCQFY